MGHIKLNLSSLVISIFLFLCLFSIILTSGRDVRATGAGVSIVGEPTYRLTNSVIKNNEVLGKTYEINITLRNGGDSRSDELTINLADEEGFSLNKTAVLQPDETKVISFTWSTITIKNQVLLISFYPSNLDTDPNEYNSGSKTFTIHVTDEADLPAASTPGFEIIFVITAIIILISLRKKRNKN